MCQKVVRVLAALAAILLVPVGAAACEADEKPLLVSPASSGGSPFPKARVPSASELTGALLEVADLPSGYRLSGEPDPESVTSSPIVNTECDRLFAAFGGVGGLGDGGGSGNGGEAEVGGEGGKAGTETSAEFEKGETGPFLTQELAAEHDAGVLHRQLTDLRALVTRCDRFTSTNADGSASAVMVTEASLFVPGDESTAFKLSVEGVMSGYLVAVRVGNTLATVVHFGLPGVEIAETEQLVRKAVDKLTPVAR
jgi:hypothetical protein